VGSISTKRYILIISLIILLFFVYKVSIYNFIYNLLLNMLELEYVLTQLRDEIKFAVAARAKELKKFWGVPSLNLKGDKSTVKYLFQCLRGGYSFPKYRLRPRTSPLTN